MTIDVTLLEMFKQSLREKGWRFVDDPEELYHDSDATYIADNLSDDEARWLLLQDLGERFSEAEPAILPNYVYAVDRDQDCKRLERRILVAEYRNGALADSAAFWADNYQRLTQDERDAEGV